MPDINININDVSTAEKQDTQITEAQALNANVGAKADAVASSDTGSFSIISFIKRGLQNWTTLQAKIPSLVGGKIPVDVGTVTVTGGLTDAQLRAAPVDIIGALTDDQLRAAPLDINITNTFPLPVDTGLSQPLTDTELRATPVNVDTGLVQALTDAQLRASRVNVDSLVSGAKFLFSENGVNSSDTNLAVGASFTGTIEDITNYPAISMLFFATQNCRITVFQYEDAAGAIEVNSQVFDYTRRTNFSRSYVVNGNYIRVVVKNVGIATTTTLALDTAYGVIDGATQLNNTPTALNEVAGNATRDIWRCTFSNVIASGVDPSFFDIIGAIGTGQTVSQSGGNLVLTAGTTANSETIIRSTRSFNGSMISRIQSILSSRIINTNFFVELVDVIGDGLTCVINSAVSVTVTIPNNPFTAANVGQGMYLGKYSGTGTFAPQRGVIASVSGNDVTYTVASMAAGTGTVSVFGWNYYQLTYTGTTATSANYDAQRRGWNSGVTAATINTTAAPGHMAIMQNDDGNAYLLDQLVASTTIGQPSARASRVINIPEENTQLFLQIRMANGTTNPASSITWTVGMSSVEKYSPLPMSVNSIKPSGWGNQIPVFFAATQSVSAAVSSLPALVASTARIGFTAGSGVWYDDSSTNLGSSATFTGTSRDLTVSATGVTFAGAGTFAEELRVSAESDVTGTLWIETSRDNTNWRRVKSVNTTAVSGGGFAAEIIHRPSWRYARVGYTNAGVAQARFTIGTITTA